MEAQPTPTRPSHRRRNLLIAAVVVVGVLAAVGAARGNTTPTAAIATPLASAAVDTSDAHVTAVMRATILAEGADWPVAGIDIGRPDVSTRQPVLFVGSTLNPLGDYQSKADALCRNLAALHFDENAVDLGFRAVVIISGTKQLAQCDVR
jgi:hypothetical protein